MEEECQRRRNKGGERSLEEASFYGEVGHDFGENFEYWTREEFCVWD